MDIIEWYRLNSELDAGLTVHRKPISDPLRGIRRAEHVERWSRLRELGHGGFGTVFLEKEEAGKLRAVKEVRKKFSKERGQDYLRELLAMAWFSKDQACFPRFQGWFEDDATIYIAMEYFELGDLSRCVAGPLPELEGKTITFQVAEALVMLHSKAITHRDVKPENIFVFKKGPDWWVKLGDFGISKRVHNQDTALYTGYIGDYVAPEINESVDTGEDEVGTYTSAVDIWALGCLVHWLLAGQVPFKKKGSISTYCHPKSAGNLPTDLSQYNLSSPALEFIKSCLAVRPKSRPTAQEAIDSTWLTEGATTVDSRPTDTARDLPHGPQVDITRPASSQQAYPSSSRTCGSEAAGAGPDDATVVVAKDLNEADVPSGTPITRIHMSSNTELEEVETRVSVPGSVDMQQKSWPLIFTGSILKQDYQKRHLVATNSNSLRSAPVLLHEGPPRVDSNMLLGRQESRSELPFFDVDMQDKRTHATVEDVDSDDVKEISSISTATRRSALELPVLFVPGSDREVSSAKKFKAQRGKLDRLLIADKMAAAKSKLPQRNVRVDLSDEPANARTSRSSSLDVHDGDDDGAAESNDRLNPSLGILNSKSRPDKDTSFAIRRDEIVREESETFGRLKKDSWLASYHSARNSLYSAAFVGRLDLVTSLLDQGADINEPNLFIKSTALHTAAANDHVAIVKALIERGANIDAKDYAGSTPLEWAERHASYSTAKVLYEAGAFSPNDPGYRASESSFDRRLRRAAQPGHGYNSGQSTGSDRQREVQEVTSASEDKRFVLVRDLERKKSPPRKTPSQPKGQDQQAGQPALKSVKKSNASRKSSKTDRPFISPFHDMKMDEQLKHSEPPQLAYYSSASQPQSSLYTSQSTQPAYTSPSAKHGYYSTENPHGPPTSGLGYDYLSQAAQVQNSMGYYGAQSTNGYGGGFSGSLTRPSGFYNSEGFGSYAQPTPHPPSQTYGGYDYPSSSSGYYGSHAQTQPTIERGYYSSSPIHTGYGQGNLPHSNMSALGAGRNTSPPLGLITTALRGYDGSSEYKILDDVPELYGPRLKEQGSNIISKRQRDPMRGFDPPLIPATEPNKPKSKWKSMLGLG